MLARNSQMNQISNDEYVRRCRQRVLVEQSRARRSLTEGRELQANMLAELLLAGRDTAFGREHGLSRVRDRKEYCQAVPIRNYDGMAPWISRVCDGESNVLTADDPILFFKTSGSTGSNKAIPVTSTFMKRCFFPFYYAALGALYEQYPGAIAPEDMTLNLRQGSSSDVSLTNSGRLHLGASQVDFAESFGDLTASEPGSRAPWSKLPAGQRWDNDLAKTYAKLRIAAEHNVECLVGINPAAVAAIPHQLALWLPGIVKDMHDGTMGGSSGFPANRSRARELERIARGRVDVLPREIWPNIKALYCWTGGVASLYVDPLKQSFGDDVALVSAPLAASEGPIALSTHSHCPASASLAVSNVVFEFIDADQSIRPNSETLEYCELDRGREYHVVISHLGGLHRYALGDVVRVVDQTEGAPLVEYAGRHAASDVAGERLRDSHFVRAAGETARACSIEIANVACKVEAVPGVPRQQRYSMLIATEGDLSEEAVKVARARLDEELGCLSPGYRKARCSAALGEISLQTVRPAAFFHEWQSRVLSGVRAAQAKDRVLVSDETWQRLSNGNFPVLSKFVVGQ